MLGYIVTPFSQHKENCMHKDDLDFTEKKLTKKESDAALALKIQITGLCTHFKISCRVPPAAPTAASSALYQQLHKIFPSPESDKDMTPSSSTSRFFSPKMTDEDPVTISKEPEKKETLKKKKKKKHNRQLSSSDKAESIQPLKKRQRRMDLPMPKGPLPEMTQFGFTPQQMDEVLASIAPESAGDFSSDTFTLPMLKPE